MALYFCLEMFFYVPSLNRNLISISRLDKDGFECHFGHGQCAILCNNAYIGTAYLHDELYLLSLREKVNSVCDVNVHVANDSESENVQKKERELMIHRRNYGNIV
jgi:hypothetical protein